VIFAFDDFELDVERFELRKSGKLVKADSLVLRLLHALVLHAGRLVTKDEIVEHVWQGRAVADNVITVSMARLRKVLGHSRGERELVTTVYGRGYRFVRDVTTRAGVPRASTPPPTVHEVAPPLVGRERVLARLHEALAEARAGRGRMCALLGEPGIGKTRLVEELERSLLGQDVRVAWGYCPQGGGTAPLFPVQRLLREVAGAAENTSSVLEQGFDEVLRRFARAAEQAPLLLVLDDLQRADGASLELLQHFVVELARMRILIVATLQHPAGAEALPPALGYVLGHRNCERIQLDRLPPEAVASYVGALLEDPDGRLGRAVFAKSEGNPFFMTELARQLRDAEQPDPDALKVPDTALELLRQRVARLDADTRDLLCIAAVIGRSFELPLLAAITEREPFALMAALDPALAAEIIVADPASPTAFAFGHELLRSVLYDGLGAAEQRRSHLRVARSLEQRAAAGETVSAAELAFHCHAALPEGDLRKTVEHCRRAAAAASAIYANPDVVPHLRHALQALDLIPDGSLRLRANLLWTIAIFVRGQAIEFPKTIREVLRLAREIGDGRLLVNAASMLNPHPGFQPIPGGDRALREGLELLGPDEHASRAIGLAALACVPPQCFSAERCYPLLDEALALARKTRDPRALRVALDSALYLRGGPAFAAQVGEHVTEIRSVAQARAGEMRVVPVQLAMREAIAALQRGDAAAVAAAVERSAAASREIGHVELLWHSDRFALVARLNAGVWSEGLVGLETLHRRALQRPILGTAAFCAFDRVVAFGELAGNAALDDETRAALQYEPADPPSLWALKVRALASAGLTGEAKAALRVVSPADLARLPCDADYLGTLGHLGRAAVELRLLDHAQSLLALLGSHPDHYAGQVSFLCEGSVPQLLGMLEYALGRLEPAIAHLQTGVTSNDQAGLLPRALEARLQLARCLKERGGDEARAAALCREAKAGAERFGMQRLAREAASVERL
jgi:DNA-binding winged helix-turn-helix (wHTH) protein